MISVYISGPLSKPSRKKGRFGRNIKPAMQVHLDLWAMGYYPYCPHLGHYFDVVFPRNDITYDEWMETDLHWLGKCDAMLRLPGESKGADMEEAYAKLHGIPVYYSIAELDNAIKKPCWCIGCTLARDVMGGL